VKTKAGESENWDCEKCRTERVRMLQDELQNALRQIEELKARNRELEEKLPLAGAGKRDTEHAKQKVAKCFVVGD
jgi:predicted RNase H-like nuclease (RuvC/YqgF family)